MANNDSAAATSHAHQGASEPPQEVPDLPHEPEVQPDWEPESTPDFKPEIPAEPPPEILPDREAPEISPSPDF